MYTYIDAYTLAKELPYLLLPAVINCRELTYPSLTHYTEAESSDSFV